MSPETIAKALDLEAKNEIVPCRIFPISATTTPRKDILQMLSWACDEIIASKGSGKKPKVAAPKKDQPEEEDVRL